MSCVYLSPSSPPQTLLSESDNWQLPPSAWSISESESDDASSPESPAQCDKIRLAASFAEQARKLCIHNNLEEASKLFLMAASHLKSADTWIKENKFYLYLDRAIKCFWQLREKEKPTEELLQCFEKTMQEWIDYWAPLEPDYTHHKFFEKLADFYRHLEHYPKAISYALRAAAAQNWHHEWTLANFKKALACCSKLEDDSAAREKLQQITEKAMEHYQLYSLPTAHYVEFWKELAIHCKVRQLHVLAAQCFDLTALCHLANLSQGYELMMKHWLQVQSFYDQCLEEVVQTKQEKEIAYYEKRVRSYWTPLLYQFLHVWQCIDWVSFILHLYEERPHQGNQGEILTAYESCIENYCTCLEKASSQRLVRWGHSMAARTHDSNWLLDIFLTVPLAKRQACFSLLQSLGSTARFNAVEIANIITAFKDPQLELSTEEVTEMSRYLCRLKSTLRDDAKLIGRLTTLLMSLEESDRQPLYILTLSIQALSFDDYILARTLLDLWEENGRLAPDARRKFYEEIDCTVRIANTITTWTDKQIEEEPLNQFLDATTWVRGESLVNWLLKATHQELQKYLQSIENILKKDPLFPDLQQDFTRFLLLRTTLS